MDSSSLTTAVPVLVCSAACVACATTDLRRFRVPNAITLPLLASGPVFHAATAGWSGLWLALAGAAFGFVVLLVPYALGAMGAGDVKLLAGLGAWLGRPLTSDVLFASIVFAGLYALIVATLSGRLRRTLAEVWSILTRGARRPGVSLSEAASRPDRRGRLVPFAAMMALGLFATIARA